MKQITVIDYGAGNLLSVCRALEACGYTVGTTSDPAAAAQAEALVLPGVGAFGDGMVSLHRRGLDEATRHAVQNGAPLLGICLGMQMLFDESEEGGLHKGLGLIPGRAVRIPDTAADGSPLRVPHVGWEALEGTPRGFAGTALEHLGSAQVYFVHSFAAQPACPDDLLACARYGGHAVCAAVQRGKVLGCQFHPEKSGPAGLAILRAFFG